MIMPTRLILALIILVGVTAFAPAPFPRKDRRGTILFGARSMEGLWKVEKVERSNKGGYLNSTSLMSHIQIQGGRWIFMRNNGGVPTPSTNYRLVIHTDRRPIALDGMRDNNNTPYMLGIIREVNDTIQVLYRFSGNRPADFDSPPEGCWRITLRREK
jgi:hypothetical protein